MILNRYRLKIVGKDPKRLLKSLNKKKINLYQVNMGNNYLIIDVSYEDYKKIKDIKTVLYEVEVLDVFGIKKVNELFHKYQIFIGCFLVGIFLFLVLINTIFEVEIITSDKDIKNLLLEELAINGISKYKFVKSYEEVEKIKANILKKNRDKIEWLEIERIGTKYTVKLELRKIKDLDLDDTPRDLIAKKNGIIKELKVESGEILRKVNDYVRKGDVIVSGKITKDDEIKKIVKAKGKIYAETWYNIIVEEPIYYKEEQKTGKYNYVLEVQFLDNYYRFFDFSKFKTKKTTSVFSLDNCSLPISVGISKQEEMVVVEELNTVSNAIFLASLKAKEKLLDTLDEDAEILMQKSLKITEEDSKIIIEVFFKVKENITDYINISVGDINSSEKTE